MSSQAESLRQSILKLVSEYHQAAFPEVPFIPGETPVPVAGRVFDSADVTALVGCSLDFWLTAGLSPRVSRNNSPNLLLSARPLW